MKDKVDPYLRPLYDALYDMLPMEQVERRLASGEIEIAPIAFMRGRTLATPSSSSTRRRTPRRSR
jgi:phosphate starvation-inducible PhoH-like protein